MAISETNLFTRGFHGKVGDQFVLKRHGNSMVLCALPAKSKKKPSAAITKHRNRFKAATKYAKGVLANPDLQLLYLPRVEKYVNIYNLALADFMNKPTVEQIDAAGYTGQPGDQISIMAYDDTRVTRVSVALRSGDGKMLEQGHCTQPDGSNTWKYTVTGSYSSTTGQQVVVTVRDQPGNEVMKELAL